MSDLQVGDMHVAPGEYGEGWVEGVELTTTHSVDIPVMGVNGAGEGPTLLLFSMQHGIEIQNVGIVHSVMRDEVSPADLNGQIIGVPVANPLAYMHATYRSWIDNGDLGYDTAEAPGGTPSERLTATVWDEIWSQADLIMNMHANSRTDSLPYQAIRVAEDTIEDQERMVRALGLTTIRYEGVHEGPGTVRMEGDVTPTLAVKAARAGIPVVVTEMIESRWITEPSQTYGIEGTLNLLREYDMLPGGAETGHELMDDLGATIVPCEYTGGSGLNRSIGMIRANKGGVFYPQKDPGEPIQEGEVVAEVVDLHGNTVEEVGMPQDGYVWAYPGSQAFEVSGALQTIEEGGWLAFGFVHEEEYSPTVMSDA